MWLGHTLWKKPTDITRIVLTPVQHKAGGATMK